MSKTFKTILALIAREELRISEHGYDELSADNLTVRELVVGVADAVVVEDYPDYPKGPCVLVLQRDKTGQPIHVVWGIPAGNLNPVVLVTAYRPDPARWDEKFMRRRQ